MYLAGINRDQVDVLTCVRPKVTPDPHQAAQLERAIANFKVPEGLQHALHRDTQQTRKEES